MRAQLAARSLLDYRRSSPAVPASIPYCGASRDWDTVAAGLYRVGIPGGTVYRGFDQSQYDRLLAWTSYSVMHNVANGYNALSAYATGNAELARQQITARTLWWGFIYSYLLGASDRRHDGVGLSRSLPRFTTVDHTTCQ